MFTSCLSVADNEHFNYFIKCYTQMISQLIKDMIMYNYYNRLKTTLNNKGNAVTLYDSLTLSHPTPCLSLFHYEHFWRGLDLNKCQMEKCCLALD